MALAPRHVVRWPQSDEEVETSLNLTPLPSNSAGNLFIADFVNQRIRQVSATFSLDEANPDDNDGIEPSITFADIPVGIYAITENLPAGWQLDDATCTGASAPVSLNGQTLSVALGAGETVVCTFENSLLSKDDHQYYMPIIVK